jgi:hypothetical protein
MMLEFFDPNDIQNLEQARQAITEVLNLVEELVAENRKQREEIQRLRDENNRLKGEQGKPKVKPRRKPPESTSSDHSSEQERRTPKKRQKRKKVSRIQVDREEKVSIDAALLPADAAFKGYESVVVQDIQLRTDNVRFLKEKYYSSSAGQSYLADQPVGYEGEFGPGVKALTRVLYHALNVSEPKIEEFYAHIGVQISSGKVSNLLIKNQDRFHDEKDALYEAGLHSSPWQHIDDTATRVNGVNQHCHVVCNPLYTAYFTTEKKNRLTVLDILTNFRSRTYLLNDETYAWLVQIGLSARVIERLQKLPRDQVLSEELFFSLLDQHQLGLGPQQQQRVLEAAAVTAYHAQEAFPVVALLLSDDAPQFKRLTEELALCWIHDARHYKKLSPAVAHHRKLLKQFMERYWDFYHKLVAHQLDPTPEHATQLEAEFDALFSTVTGYTGLDRRIAMTRDKKEPLLMVLRHPEIPLHNNPAEIEIRRRVRKRDVSFGPRTEEGKRAWDTFATLAATAKKLGVSFYEYIYDRVSGANNIPDLADLIAQRANQLNLGASWGTA